MRATTAGIILAGGRSSRMGADKALLEIEGETMLARIARVVSTVVSEVVIVGRTALPPELEGTRAVTDAYGEAGPLGGIATGLVYLDTEHALVVACDLPYLQADLLRLLVELAPGYDAVVPRLPHGTANSRPDRESREGAMGEQARGPAPTHGTSRGKPATTGRTEKRPGGSHEEDRSERNVRAHPTCAVYAQSCVPVMLGRLAEGRYRLGELLDPLQVRWVEEDEIRRVDPEGWSFLNVNTPDDWSNLTSANRSRRCERG